MAQFSNMATLSYNGTVANSNIVTGEIVEVLSAAKTAVTDTYTGDDKLAYVVSVVNSGTTAYNNLTLTDNLGGYTSTTGTVYPLTYVPGSVKLYVNGVLQPQPTATAGPPLTITGINIPANSNAVIVYEAETNGFTPLAADSTVNNTATLTGTGITTPVTADETVTAAAAPVLSISKSLSPTVVNENGQVTYTFTITNTSNTEADAADNVVLSDTFDPPLSNISVTYNGTAWTDPTNYTYNDTTGAFSTVAGQITAPAATYTTNADGSIATTPGTATVTVTGTL